MLYLKYLATILTLGTAFVGTWFVEYVRTDKDTGKKTLTVWGRRAIIFAGIGLTLTLALNVWTDHESIRRAEEERAAANESRQKSEQLQGEIHRMVGFIAHNYGALNQQAKQEAKETISTLSNLEDYRARYPDLYSAIVSAPSATEATAAIRQGIDRAENERIAQTPGCAELVNRWPGGSPTKTFRIGDDADLMLLVSVKGVDLTFSDSGQSPGIVRTGYQFIYQNGERSEALRCKLFSTQRTCKDSTADPKTKDVYLQMRNNRVAGVRASNKEYIVAEDISLQMQQTFSCIKP